MPRRMFISAKQPRAGCDWYYGFACKSCGENLALFEDPSHGTVRFPYDSDVLITSQCRRCNAVHDYRDQEVEAFNVRHC